MLSPTRALLAAALAATVGCASFDPGPTVTATARLLEERGVPGADWHREAAQTDRARLEAEELLARPLAPGDAGRLALLRSPDLQAELAELGVARAELAQASRLANPGLSFSLLRGDGETQRTTGLAADVVDWLTQPLRRRLGES